jgi:hypothetical protein
MHAKAPKEKKTKKRRVLDTNMLVEDDGMPAILNKFPRHVWKGPGHEADDLHTLMKSYRQWAFHLFPGVSTLYSIMHSFAFDMNKNDLN